MSTKLRSSAEVTLSCWKALFLRFAVSSLSSTRAAAFWLIAEPVAHIAVFMLIFTYLRVRHIGGINTALWIMAGLLAFFMFRRAAAGAMEVIGQNRRLYALPQIKPVDTVLVRVLLEGFLMAIIAAILVTAVALVGMDVVPADPLAVVVAMFGLWLFGTGYGLIGSVANELAPPVGSVMSFMLRVFYLLSGTIFPIAMLVPHKYHHWLLLNPVFHGLEQVRLGFAPYYQVLPGVSIVYLYLLAVVSIFFGLALHVRYARRLIAKHDQT